MLVQQPQGMQQVCQERTIKALCKKNSHAITQESYSSSPMDPERYLKEVKMNHKQNRRAVYHHC